MRGIREYLRPSFHPNDKDHRRVFEETLARLTAEGVVDGARDERDARETGDEADERGKSIEAA